MKLATTKSDFSRWASTSEERIRFIHEAGFRNIDISISSRLCRREDWMEEAKRIRDCAEKLGVNLIQAHSPDGNALDPNKQDEFIEITNRSIQMCEIMGVPQTVVHAGYKEGIGKEEAFEENLAFYQCLFPTMEKTGVNVLIENGTSKNLSEYYKFLTGEEMVEFLKCANHPLLHAAWDTGHANTEGTQYEHLVTLGKELYGIHVHDNSGHGDEHALPYTGTLNMDDVINGLIDADYKGYFTFEAIRIFREAMSRHGKRHEFKREQRLLEPALEMQLDAERLLYTIGKYCLSSYGLFEE